MGQFHFRRNALKSLKIASLIDFIFYFYLFFGLIIINLICYSLQLSFNYVLFAFLAGLIPLIVIKTYKEFKKDNLKKVLFHHDSD